MKNKGLKVICILLCALLLTACGEQTDLGGVSTTATELSTPGAFGVDASIPEPGTMAPSAPITQTEPGRSESDVLKNYCEIYEKMGDNANLVGYPYDMGSSHYLVDNGMLVINQNAMTKEGIKELVNDLLSLESQKYVGYAISVRTDIPESQLVYDAAGKNYIWTSPDNKGFQLSAKADGTSGLEEYVEFLKSAVPATFYSDEIFDMVMEEADSYFNSDKDVDQVIDIIQRRVQVYLDERK